MIYFKLFLTFLEIGAVSFGGGYGMISLIREAVLSNHWLFARRRVGQSARDFGRGAPIVRHYFAHCGSVE